MQSRLLMLCILLVACIALPRRAYSQELEFSDPVSQPISPSAGGQGAGATTGTNFVFLWVGIVAIALVCCVTTFLGSMLPALLALLFLLALPWRKDDPDGKPPHPSVVFGLLGGAVPIFVLCYFFPSPIAYFCSIAGALSACFTVGLIVQLRREGLL
jgi:hypothetical protein